MTLLCFAVTKQILFATLAIGTVSTAVYDGCYGKEFTTTPTSETAVIGQSKSLSCCATKYQKLKWYKNGQQIDNSRQFTTFQPHNSKSQVITSWRIRRTDTGDYTCSVYVGRDVLNKTISLKVLYKPPVKWPRLFRTVLPLVAFFGCVILYILATCWEWSLELKLCCKDKYGKLEQNDTKEYDLFICYDQKNASFVSEILVYRLEKQFEYRCFTYERDSFTGDLIPDTFTENVRLSRRFIMVVSQVVVADQNWWLNALSIATEAMSNDRSKVIGLVLEEIVWENISITNGTSDDKTLEQVLRVIPTFLWKASSTPPRVKHLRKKDRITKIKIPDPRMSTRGSKRSWRSLRVHLPPRRKIKRMLEFRW